MVSKEPPGRLVTERDGVMHAEDEAKAASYWTLDALTEAAREMGIRVSRSQVRRILLSEGVRWRNIRPWAQTSDPQSSSQKVQNSGALHQPATGGHGGLR